MAGRARAVVRFGRRPIEVREDESLAQALARRDIRLLGRSIRYHRPREPFCGVGYCTQCLVNVNGRPTVRACRYRPQPGDRVRVENGWPSARADLLAAVDLLTPSGIDTLRGFRRPRWLVPMYQRVVRRLAGYGKLPAAAPSPPTAEGPPVETDVLVVGAGDAGAAAARELTQAGRPTLLLDRDRDLRADPSAPWLGRTTALFLPPPSPRADRPFRAVIATEGAGIRLVRARSVVVATGEYDASLLFAGNDRPGVQTAAAALAFAGSHDGRASRRAVVFGGGARAAEVLEGMGDRVEAVLSPGEVAPEVVARASELAIPLYPRSLLLSVSGRTRVRSVEARHRGGGERIRLPADGLILAHRRLPHPQLFYQVGARMGWRANPGAYYPERSLDGATSVAGLFAAGAAAGIAGSAASAEDGRTVARRILGEADRAARIEAVPRGDGPPEMDGYYRELLRTGRAGGKWVACPCEDVLLEELLEAHARGYRGIEVVKRYTGLGTGLCQGRYCLPEALLVLSILEARPVAAVGFITQRPPVVPAPLGEFAALPEPPTGPAPP